MSRKLTSEERSALKETLKDTEGADAVRAKISEMPADERALAERVYDIVTKTAPELQPRTWYGMPAWAKDGKVVCFFQNAAKFKSRYATLGFSDKAKLDDGAMWPISYALTKLTPAVEKQIRALVKQAVSG